MSFGTIVVSAFLLIWFVCAVIYLYKNKGCKGDCENCHRGCAGPDREYIRSSKFGISIDGSNIKDKQDGISTDRSSTKGEQDGISTDTSSNEGK